MNIIKKVPVPLCGVMLGFAALGNLLQSYGDGYRYACGVVAAILLILILLKLICYPKMIAEDLKNPIMASVSATFPMAIMLLSTYVAPFIGQAAFVIWLLAIALHIVLIIYFTATFIVHLKMPQVHASYFIVYVGIVVAAVTAPTYDQLMIGTVAFWFGLVCLVLLLILVTVRYASLRDVPEAAQPLFCIYAAPTSLCIAGYVQSVTPKSYALLMTLYVVACILYLVGFIRMVSLLRLKFYPSYAAFTFPFVISAIASKQTMACLANMERPMPALNYVVIIETVIAVILVCYTLIRYIMFLCTPEKKQS